MTYNPLPPVRQRNGRVPMPPVFVRPSGLGEAVNTSSGRTGLGIDNMPRFGHVFADGVEVPTPGGVWVGTTWVLPFAGTATVLRVVAPDGSAREFDTRDAGGDPIQSGVNVDYDLMTPVEGTGTGTARLFGAAVAEVRVDDLPGAFQGTPSGGALLFTLPVGDHTLRLVAPDNVRWEQRVRVLPGQTTNVPLVRPAAPPPAPSRPPAGERVDISLPPLYTPPVGDRPPPAVVANGSLTVLAEPGVVLAIARGSAPTVMVAPPVTVPATGGVSTPWPAGLWLLAARRPNGEVQTRPVTVVGGQAQTVDMRVGWPAPAAASPGAGSGAGAGAGAGASPGATTANVTVTGGVGWVLTVSAAGVMVNRLPILAGGSVTFPLTPGAYFLAVDDGAGHTAAQAITVPATGLAVDVTPWLASARAPTQGPAPAAGAVGTITLTAVPPGSVVRVSALSDYTVDDSGRPVLLSLPAGSHAVTVIPPGGAPQRTGAAVVTAGGNTPLTFGALAAPSAQTGIQEVPSIESQCGPVQSPAAWMPATACPGQELVGPDGTRYRAIAVTGGVALAALKADGTVDTSWSTGTWVALGLGAAALAGAAWWFYGRDGKSTKTENPGKAKCSCGGH